VAVVAHAAVLALLAVEVRRTAPVVRAPVPLAVARPEARVAPAAPAWIRPAVRALPAPRAQPRLARRGVPVAAPVAPPPAASLALPGTAGDVARAFRAGTAPPDSALRTEVALRAAALRRATEGWNAAFAALLPEARAAMFLEALERSPFPRR
jgi:hypothetical protein